VDGGEGEEAGEAGGGRSAIDPGKLKGSEGEGEVFGAGDESAFLGLHESRSDAGAVEGLHHFALCGGPIVAVALPGSNHVSYGSTGYAAGGLDQHLQVETVGESPLNLTNSIAG
jgi:hypothetical protein